MNRPDDKSHDDRPPLTELEVNRADLPADQEAEICLLVAASGEPTGSAVVVAGQAGVKPASFYWPNHGTIWTHLELLVKERAPVDLETLSRHMTEAGDFEKIDGFRGLMAAMSGKFVPATQARHYADLVVAYWRRRHAMRLGAELRESALQATDRDEFARECGDLGRRLINLGQRAETQTLGDTIDAVAADVQARAAGKEDRSRWVYTGLKTFDARLKPLNSAREDGLTVVGGASGEGKSALMRQFAKGALDARNPQGQPAPQKVVFFNRETSTDGCIEQMASLASGLDLLQPEKQPGDVIRKFAEECARLRDTMADKYLFCYQHSTVTPLVTIEDLELRARQHAWTHGAPHLLVVDYLQLFGTTKRGVNKREEVVAHVSHTLQSLQRELGCCVLVAAQLNESGLKEMRLVRRDENDKVIHRLPGPGDFRESQAIYHDADRVLAIYRPPVDSRDQDQTGPNILKPEQWLCQIKRRKGGTGIVKCRFEKQLTRFVELPDFGTTNPAATSAPPSGGSGQTKRQFLGEGAR